MSAPSLADVRAALDSTPGATLAVGTADGRIIIGRERGVRDLFRLLDDASRPMAGAIVADKVVGKAAAALMAAGGVAAMHTRVITTDAVAILRDYGVDASGDEEVTLVINRAGTGRCPLDTRCADAHTLPDILSAVRNFMAENNLQ